MLAQLLFVPCLVLAMAVRETSSPPMLADVPKDPLMIVLSQLGFVNLRDLSSVSKHYRKLIFPFLKSLYGVEYKGQVSFYYSTIISKLERYGAEAYRGRNAAAACTVLQGIPEYMGIKAVLEAEFGVCVHYKERGLEFRPKLTVLEILNDSRKVSALPHLLDQDPGASEWIYGIQGLVELERPDLLSLLKFPKIGEAHFCLLLTVPLPAPVMVAAAKSLHTNCPHRMVSNLASFITPRLKDASMPGVSWPLFLLQHRHENGMAVPTDIVFTGGLQEESISFWMYLLGKRPEEFKELLDIVLQQGDPGTKYLAGSFRLVVWDDISLVFADQDVYQAMLLRFRFSQHSTGGARLRCIRMIREKPTLGYHTARAFIDCGQSQHVGQFKLVLNSVCALEALMASMHRRGDGNLPLLVQNFPQVEVEGRALLSHWRLLHRMPNLLKTLIQQGAANWYTQPIWEWIQILSKDEYKDEWCCLLPLESIKRLMLEKEISTDTVQKMLSEVQGYRDYEVVPVEVAVLRIVMFWEAPENIIAFFLAKVKPSCFISLSYFVHLFYSHKYSVGLLRQLSRHLQGNTVYLKTLLQELRPDLLKILD